MRSEEVLNLSLVEIGRLLRKRKLSSVELTELCLERAERAETNSFVNVFREEALRQAKEADGVLPEGGALCGIPFSMKDVYLSEGLRTTAGSRVLGDYDGQYDATVYRKLRAEGAVLIGKNNQDAWGHGGSSENTDFGPVRNPWDGERVAGGSSGGSAASVAEGSSLFSVGEDTGGSIRNPSSFCNTTGLKVTYGRVSRYGTIAYASSLDTVGPITSSVMDAALVMETIAGFDERDASSSREPVPEYTEEMKKGVEGMSVGVMKEYMGEGLTEEVRRRVEEALAEFERMGVDVKEVSVPAARYGVAIYYVLALSETSSNLARFDGVRYGRTRDLFTEESKRRIMMGTHTLSSGYYDAYYRNALKARTRLIEEFEGVFKEVDAVLAPVMPFPAYKFGEMGTADEYITAMYLADLYTCAVNPAGVPSLSLPIGFSREGLPVGGQLIGSMFGESSLFRLGYGYQQATDFHEKKPEL